MNSLVCSQGTTGTAITITIKCSGVKYVHRQEHKTRLRKVLLTRKYKGILWSILNNIVFGLGNGGMFTQQLQEISVEKGP